MLGLVGVIIVVVVVVLMLLLFRGCAAGSGSEDGSSTQKEIVSVQGLTAEPGAVSVWVAPETEVKALLAIAGLESSTITNMGGGRFVVSVPPGSEETVVRILSSNQGVYDAGRVYNLKD